MRTRLLTLTVVVGIALLSSPERPHAFGQASRPSRYQPVEKLWQAYPLNPQLSRSRTSATRAAQAVQVRNRDVLPRGPDAGSPFSWLLPLAVVAGMLVLGAAVALIRATDRLRLESLPVEERLASEAEDAAVKELTEAARPQLESAIEAGVQDARQRAETPRQEAEHTERVVGPSEPLTLHHVATILELAQHADVSAENVLRVVNGEPVSSAVAERVRRAIDELGHPYPGAALEPGPVQATLDRTRQQLVETFAETAAELEAKLPEGVGSVVYEALRVEVRPVTSQLGQMAKLVQALLEHARQTEVELQRERKERLDDVALITELITTSWRTVDRRLGRLERMLEDLRSANGSDQQVTRYVYVDKPSPPSE